MKRKEFSKEKIVSAILAVSMIAGLTVGQQTVLGAPDEEGSEVTAEEFVALMNEGTLTLTEDLKLTEDVSLAQDVVIDLGGHTLDLGDASVLITSGNVTVKNGVAKANIDAFKVESAGSAVLNIEEDADVIAGDCAVILKKEGAVLNTAGDLTSTGGAYAAIQGNGAIENGGIEVNITGGTIKSADVGVYFPGTTELNITGGTIEGKTAVYHKSGELTISGGTLKAFGEKAPYVHGNNGCEATGDALVIEACDYPGGVPAVSITGGTFISENAKSIGYYQQSEEYSLEDELFIYNGTFSDLPVDYAVANSTLTLNNDLTLDENLMIDEEALTYFNIDLNGKTVTLKENALINVKEGNVSFDNGIINAEKNAFRVEGGAQLELKPDLDVNAKGYVVFIKEQDSVLATHADLKSTGEYDMATITGNGNTGNGGVKVFVHDGSIINERVTAIYFPNTTELSVKDGVIEGTTGIYHKSGNLNISGGEIKAFGPKAEYVHGNNGCVETGDALVIEACDYPGGVPVVEITGGKFTSENADAIGYYQQSEEFKLAEEKFIHGGEFSSDVTKFCAHPELKTEVINAKESTCTEEGYTGDTICSVCKDELAKGTKIELKEHEFVEGKCECGLLDMEAVETETITPEEAADGVAITTIVKDEKTEETITFVGQEVAGIAEEIKNATDLTTTPAVANGIVSLETAEAMKAALDAGKVIKPVVEVKELTADELNQEMRDKLNTYLETLLDEAEKSDPAYAGLSEKVTFGYKYLDISVVLKSEDGVIGTVDKFSDKLTLTFAMDENTFLDEMEESLGEKRFYAFFHGENNEFVLVDSSVADNLITFETDSFSPYAIAFMTVDGCLACVDANGDKNCDVCGKPIAAHECVDANTDNVCDVCKAPMTAPEHTCKDDDANNKCDICGEDMTTETPEHTCKDDDTNGKCDICDTAMPVVPGEHTCKDDDADKKCDICGEDVEEPKHEHTDADKNGICDDETCKDMFLIRDAATVYKKLCDAVKAGKLDDVKAAVAEIEVLSEKYADYETEGEEREMTDEELALFLEIMGCKDEEELFGELLVGTFGAAMLLDIEEKYNAFVANENKDTAKALVDAIDGHTDLEYLKVSFADIEEVYARAKALVPAEEEHKCVDANKDGKCDVCEKTMPVDKEECACVDANKDGKCDLCGKAMDSEKEEHKCVDENKDGKCDDCDKSMEPQTGDEMNVALYSIVNIASLLSAAFVTKRKIFK